jgi:hypothetical protein
VNVPQRPSGWFDDPLGRYDHRWFNGTTWTSDVSVDGRRFVDPLGISPGPEPGAATQRTGNTAATAAMICGLVGAAIAWAPFVVIGGIILGIVAVALGVSGLRRSRDAGRGRGAAITGLVAGGVSLALSVVGVVLTVVVTREVLEFIDPGPRFVDEVVCEVDGREVVVSGTITNLDDDRHDYTVFVTVDDRMRYTSVELVDPGEVVDWSVRLRTDQELSDCDPDVVVNGPFPFGIETDPVRD